ncbi:hypothetical protein ACJJTC_017541 [Scirpophaga incertulas]
MLVLRGCPTRLIRTRARLRVSPATARVMLVLRVVPTRLIATRARLRVSPATARVISLWYNRSEPSLSADVLLPLRDDQLLSVDDYRKQVYSIMSESYPETGLSKPSAKSRSHPGKTHAHPSKTAMKITKSLDSEFRMAKPRHISAPADPKGRMKAIRPAEKPLKEYRSDQTISKPLRVTRGYGNQFSETSNYAKCRGDFSQPVVRQSSGDIGYAPAHKTVTQQRRNSTSFSTVNIGGDTELAGYNSRSRRHGVITASALMDLRTSIH